MTNDISQKNTDIDIVSVQNIEGIIHEVRGKQVILDSDLANLYQVSTKRLNEQVKRNIR